MHFDYTHLGVSAVAIWHVIRPCDMDLHITHPALLFALGKDILRWMRNKFKTNLMS